MTATTTINFAGFIGFLGRGAAPRELQCLMAVASGQTSKEAARDLGVSPDTVDKRILALTTKLGVTRRAALVAKAFALGLIQTACVISPNPGPQHTEHDDQFEGVFIA